MKCKKVQQSLEGGKKSIALTFMVSMFFVGNKTYFTLLNEVYCQTL